MTASQHEALPDPLAILATGLVQLVDLLYLPTPGPRRLGVAAINPAWRVFRAPGWGTRSGTLRHSVSGPRRGIARWRRP